MIILGIETSCDETATAVVENGTKILSNVVASSVEMHAKTGGIIPEVAAREQIKWIIPVIQETINRAGFSKPVEQLNSETVLGKTVKKDTGVADYRSTDLQSNRFTDIDAFAVTVGPGLIGSLLVGVETAKTLAYVWQKPIVPVNHLVGHIYANWLWPENIQQTTKHTEPEFPAIALVVSGGHTDLVLMKDHGMIKWIGGTRDDAAGECFDKTARLLGLGYPGGPAISAEAEKCKVQSAKCIVKLPRPIMDEDNFDFSFSGLKTAVIKEVNSLKNNQPFDTVYSEQRRTAQGKQFNNLAIQQLSYELQEAITDVLVSKTLKAAEKYHVKSILLAGGVSANSRLREKFHLQLTTHNLQLFVPPPHLCTDNAAYIASCAYFNYKPVPWQKITVNPGLTISDKI